MKAPIETSLLAAEAIVQKIDVVSREIFGTMEGVSVTIYAPPGCGILLRGEPVKLRMMQPRDRLRFSYFTQGDVLIANAIEVHPSFPSAPCSN